MLGAACFAIAIGNQDTKCLLLYAPQRRKIDSPREFDDGQVWRLAAFDDRLCDPW
jgi:hypothetical protein